MHPPVVASVLLAFDGHAFGGTDLAPVARLRAAWRMTEPRSFSLTRVVTAPVEQGHSQAKPAVGCIDGFGMILGDFSVLPDEEIVSDSMQDGHQVRRFTLYSLELLAYRTDDPEVGWYQAHQVRVSELHGEVVAHVYRSQQDGDGGSTVFVPEKRNAVAHAH